MFFFFIANEEILIKYISHVLKAAQDSHMMKGVPLKNTRSAPRRHRERASTKQLPKTQPTK